MSKVYIYVMMSEGEKKKYKLDGFVKKDNLEKTPRKGFLFGLLFFSFSLFCYPLFFPFL